MNKYKQPRHRKEETCHYCPARATTRDHIVARAHLPRLGVPLLFHQANVVPSCGPCNSYKSHYRSDCECDVCLMAWSLARAFLDPKVLERIEVRKVISKQPRKLQRFYGDVNMKEYYR